MTVGPIIVDIDLGDLNFDQIEKIASGEFEIAVKGGAMIALVADNDNARQKPKLVSG